MATPGSPWVIEKEVIVKAIKKRKGVLSKVKKDLEVAYSTLLKKIKADPELEQLLQDERNAYHEEILDAAEEALEYGLTCKETDLASSLKAAFYTLNGKGESRGWKNTNANSSTFVFKEIDPTKRDTDTTQV